MKKTIIDAINKILCKHKNRVPGKLRKYFVCKDCGHVGRYLK